MRDLRDASSDVKKDDRNAKKDTPEDFSEVVDPSLLASGAAGIAGLAGFVNEISDPDMGMAGHLTSTSANTTEAERAESTYEPVRLSDGPSPAPQAAPDIAAPALADAAVAPTNTAGPSAGPSTVDTPAIATPSTGKPMDRSTEQAQLPPTADEGPDTTGGTTGEPDIDPWAPDGDLTNSVADGFSGEGVVFELAATDQYGAPLEYTLTDANGTPLSESDYVIDGNLVRLAPGADVDFEAGATATFYITATNEGGVSGPWEVVLTITDVAEDLAVSDGGVNFVDTGVAELSIAGGTGDDTLTGHEDGAVIDGGAGRDQIAGSAGSDNLDGGDGADTIAGQGGDDQIDGGQGADYVTAGSGQDTVSGGAGDDTLDGGESADSLDGGLDADLVSGGAGDDTVSGGSGNDVMLGGAEDDTLIAGSGDDIIDGGADTDIAVFSGAWSDYTITEAGGTYTVTDNRPGSPDGTDTITNVEVFRFADGDVSPADALNDGPSVAAVDGAITENDDGAVVGAVSATDPDAGDTVTLTVDDARFEVVGGQLKLKDGESLDYEADGATVS
ncbi:MAG: calcium-binding protein, partial [Pseudomonadota bacterium]